MSKATKKIKIVIEIDTTSEAFNGDNFDYELSDIIDRVTSKVKEGYRGGLEHDSNGNNVCKYLVVKK